jgi:hypothetical protein
MPNMPRKENRKKKQEKLGVLRERRKEIDILDVGVKITLHPHPIYETAFLFLII